MQKSLALLSSSGNAEGELHSLLLLYSCKIAKSIEIEKFVALLICMLYDNDRDCNL